MQITLRRPPPGAPPPAPPRPGGGAAGAAGGAGAAGLAVGAFRRRGRTSRRRPRVATGPQGQAPCPAAGMSVESDGADRVSRRRAAADGAPFASVAVSDGVGLLALGAGEAADDGAAAIAARNAPRAKAENAANVEPAGDADEGAARRDGPGVIGAGGSRRSAEVGPESAVDGAGVLDGVRAWPTGEVGDRSARSVGTIDEDHDARQDEHGESSARMATAHHGGRRLPGTAYRAGPVCAARSADLGRRRHEEPPGCVGMGAPFGVTESHGSVTAALVAITGKRLVCSAVRRERAGAIRHPTRGRQRWIVPSGGAEASCGSDGSLMLRGIGPAPWLRTPRRRAVAQRAVWLRRGQRVVEALRAGGRHGVHRERARLRRPNPPRGSDPTVRWGPRDRRRDADRDRRRPGSGCRTAGRWQRCLHRCGEARCRGPPLRRGASRRWCRCCRRSRR